AQRIMLTSAGRLGAVYKDDVGAGSGGDGAFVADGVGIAWGGALRKSVDADWGVGPSGQVHKICQIGLWTTPKQNLARPLWVLRRCMQPDGVSHDEFTPFDIPHRE